MMNVQLEVSSLGAENLSGVGIYIQNLYRNLVELSSEGEVSPIVKLSRWKSCYQIANHIEVTPKVFLPMLHSRKNQIFHGPDFQVLSGLRGPSVVTVHDLAFFEEGLTSPEFAKQRREKLDHLVNKYKPNAYLTVSQSTKDALSLRYPGVRDRVFVTHLGHEHLLLGPSSELRALPKVPYFLFVGNLEARKNIARLLVAFERYCELEKDDEIELILVGKPGYGYAEIEKTWMSLNHRKQIKIPGHVDSATLKAYYRSAIALLYPSLYEGFGIPLVEAMLEGCPVLTANATSTVEVAGDAALLVDPLETDEIAEGIRRLRREAPLREQLSLEGRSRVSHFSWKACAEKTTDVYKSLL
jgi:glycosyltransferase involved in cell wall biosynthesis